MKRHLFWFVVIASISFVGVYYGLGFVDKQFFHVEENIEAKPNEPHPGPKPSPRPAPHPSPRPNAPVHHGHDVRGPQHNLGHYHWGNYHSHWCFGPTLLLDVRGWCVEFNCFVYWYPAQSCWYRWYPDDAIWVPYDTLTTLDTPYVVISKK